MTPTSTAAKSIAEVNVSGVVTFFARATPGEQGENRIGQGLAARSGADAVLNQQPGEVGRRGKPQAEKVRKRLE
jgi:hypothetical protein